MSHLARAVKFSVEIQELKEELEEKPVKVREVEQEIQSLLGDYEQKKSSLNQAETEKRRLELELQTETEQLKHKEERLNSIKTQKEYQAVVREITTSKTANKERESQILKYTEVIDNLRTELAPLEEKLQGLKAKQIEESSQIQGSLTELEEKIKNLQSQLQEQLSALPDDVRERYRRIEEKVQPPAVVVVGGACSGCFMHLPPQVYIEVQKGQEILSCPTCHRLLYLQVD